MFKFNKFESILYIFSCSILILSYFLFKNQSLLPLITSLLGITAVLFVAKGDVYGQILTIVFSFFYAYISFKNRYYGEMLTYVGMGAPMALIATITWFKHPYKDREVKVNMINKNKFIILFILDIIVTILFYFILKYFHTNQLIISTLSITTSFYAASLVALRSPYYALAYSLNDIVLVILWILATFHNMNYLPMLINFSIFLLNDLYGYYNWKKMSINQKHL